MTKLSINVFVRFRKEVAMTKYNSEHLDIHPMGCTWDPVDPHLCFDETSCGCYISPCEYFDMDEKDCKVDTSDSCPLIATSS